MRLVSLSTLGLSMIIASFIMGCGGSSSSKSNSKSDETTVDVVDVVTLIKGYLIDAPVEGVDYSCGDIRGITTSTGEFSCEEAPVDFSISLLKLGTIDSFTSDGNVYPQDIVGVDRDNFDDPRVIALARLLQSLDDDGDIDDKITISKETSDKFDTNLSGLDLESQVAIGDGTLVGQIDALAHLQSNMSTYISTESNNSGTSTDSNDSIESSISNLLTESNNSGTSTDSDDLIESSISNFLRESNNSE